MDGILSESLGFGIFLLATLAAAVVAGIAGFAFGLIAAAVWLHILSPVESATLIVFYGLIVQGVAVWKLRHAIDWARLWPFLLGGALGVPAGVTLLDRTPAGWVRLAIGALLLVYSVYSLLCPPGRVTAGGRLADAGIGVLNGVCGGLTGLAGILVTVWCGLRGWPKDVQRTVFQPVAVAVFFMSVFWLGARGAVSAEAIRLFLLGLPALLAGTWLGLKLYGRLDESGFRKIVLVLLFVSGLALMVSPR